MGGAEKFCLRWNDFESNVSSAFRELREQKDFFDVTLACEDEQIHAHKVILGACSSFFRAVLRRNPHQHPLLYLKGVKYADLESVLNFMYHGEVNVAQDDLNSFLAVAEELKVKGLTQNQNGEGGSSSNSTSTKVLPTPSSAPSHDSPRSPPRTRPPPDRDSGIGPPIKRPRVNTAPQPPHPPPPPVEDDDIQEVLPVKVEPKEMSTPSASTSYDNQALVQQDDSSYAEEGYEDYGEYEEQYVDQGQAMPQGDKAASAAMQASGSTIGNRKDLINHIDLVRRPNECPLYICNICGKTNSQKSNLLNHVESVHFPSLFLYECPYCGRAHNTKNALSVHISVKHKLRKFQDLNSI